MSELRKYRRLHEYTQFQLANAVGMNLTEKDISDYEVGRKRPTPHVALEICKVLGEREEDVFPSIFVGVQ